MALGENFKAKAWERIGKRQLLLDKFITRIHKLLVSTSRIMIIVGMAIEVKPTLQLQE